MRQKIELIVLGVILLAAMAILIIALEDDDPILGFASGLLAAMGIADAGDFVRKWGGKTA